MHDIRKRRYKLDIQRIAQNHPSKPNLPKPRFQNTSEPLKTNSSVQTKLAEPRFQNTSVGGVLCVGAKCCENVAASCGSNAVSSCGLVVAKNRSLQIVPKHMVTSHGQHEVANLMQKCHHRNMWDRFLKKKDCFPSFLLLFALRKRSPWGDHFTTTCGNLFATSFPVLCCTSPVPLTSLSGKITVFHRGWKIHGGIVCHVCSLVNLHRVFSVLKIWRPRCCS